MKRIFVWMVTAGQFALIGHSAPRIWFHGGFAVGSVSGRECWGELNLQNTGRRAKTLTVTARRYDGRQLAATTYTLVPGEKRQARIDEPNPDRNMNAAANGRMPIEAYCTLLIEGASAEIKIELRQMELYGDLLKTSVLGSSDGGNFDTRASRNARFMGELTGAGGHYYILSNLGGTPEEAEFCLSIDPNLGCVSESERIELAPLQTVFRSLPANAAPYLIIITRTAGIFVGVYHEENGSLSTFNVNSNVTFGAPVK